MVFWRELTRMKAARATWKSQLRHPHENPLKKRNLFKKCGTNLLRLSIKTPTLMELFRPRLNNRISKSI